MEQTKRQTRTISDGDEAKQEIKLRQCVNGRRDKSRPLRR